MKTELLVLLAAALALSGFSMYKQYTMVKSIGTIEFRWQTKSSKVRFIVMMSFYLIVFGIVLYQTPTVEPLIITAFIALLPIYLYRPLGYEYIGQDGILVRNGGLRLHWFQITAWTISEEEGRPSLRIEFKRDPASHQAEAADIVIPPERRPEIEMAMQKGVIPQG